MTSSSHLIDCGPGLTLLKQNSGVDGSAMIASAIGQRLKQSKEDRVLLVATHHNYSHYSSACMKLAHNLGPAVASGQLQIVDVGGELYQNYPEGVPNLAKIWKRIETFLVEYPKGSVLLDDLTYFLNFGHSEAQLIDFVESIESCRGQEQFVLIKLNTADLYQVLCANLDDLALVEIRLEKLASGNFREVDGRMSVSRSPLADDDQSLIGVKRTEKSVLYKVNERNIRAFVPGEVGIKNL